jgi:heme exporter protein A
VDFDRISFTNVSRYFERRRALSHVTLECAGGEIVGLLGHNGAGKSTLLSIAATLLRPSAGEIRYGTAAFDDAGPDVRRRIGVLGHETQLYGELTATENLRFFASLYGMNRIEDRVALALSRAELSRRAHDAVSGFSRGMRQRLALERALLHEPRLLLLDEPFTGLDHHASLAMADRLASLAAEGRIVLLATHDLDLAERVVTRAAILRDGRLAAIHNDPRSLRARYLDAQIGTG